MLRVPLAPTRIRQLDAEDMLRMRIGQRFWQTSLKKIPNTCDHKKPLAEFIANLHEHHERGEGLLIFGDYGSGKTSGGVLVLKETAARGGTGLMLQAERVTTAVMEKLPFDEHDTLWERAQSVDVLLLDDLRREHVKDFGRSVIESLIRRRSDLSLPTIITTNATVDDLLKRYEAAMEALSESCESLEFNGINWRSDEDEG